MRLKYEDIYKCLCLNTVGYDARQIKIKSCHNYPNTHTIYHDSSVRHDPGDRFLWPCSCTLRIYRFHI